MNRSLITFGFLRMMMPPPSKKPIADPVTAATMSRLFDESRWRQYDFPAYRRFVSKREKEPLATSNVLQLRELPAFLRRQA